MFNFRPSRFAQGGGDPWFRIGTFDIGSAGIVSLVVAVSMFFRAAEGANGPLGSWAPYVGSDVLDGQIWRMFTWWLPNEPSLWTVITVVMIYLFGSQLEAALGSKERMATYLGAMILIPSVLALILDLSGISGTPISFLALIDIPASLVSSALFYSYVAHIPNAQFFFGIPGWVMGAVFFVIRLLQVIQQRNLALIILTVLALVITLLTAKAFGLAEEVAWIPDLKGARGQQTQSAPRQTKRPRRPKRSRKGGPDLTVVPGAPVTSSVDDFDEMGIDEILDQVNAFGMESLSSEQKRRLKEYSKRKKK